MNTFERECLAAPERPVASGRRRFLTGIIYGLSSIIAGALSLSSGLYLFGKNSKEDQNDWVDAGDFPLLSSGVPRKLSFLRTRVDGWKTHTQKESAWLIKNVNNQLTAFSATCTHLGCPYRWDAAHEKFVCPCHGSWFSRTGQVISGPAPRPLDQYEVRLEGTRVLLGPLRKSRETKAS